MNAIVAADEAVHGQASAMPCPRSWLAALRNAAWLALGVLGIGVSIFAFGGAVVVGLRRCDNPPHPNERFPGAA